MKKFFSFLLIYLSIQQHSMAQNFHSIASFSKFVPRLQFSHDGRLLAAANMAGGSGIGYLEIYDVTTEAVLASIPGDATFAAFSGDDKKVMTRTDGHTVTIYDISDVKHPKPVMDYLAEGVWGGDMNADGSIIALACDDGQAFVINTTGKTILAKSRPFTSVLGFTCCYNNCKFCPVWNIKLLDGSHYVVAGAGMNGRVQVMAYDGHISFTSPYLGEMKGWSADLSNGRLLVNCIADSPVYGLYTGFAKSGNVKQRINTLQFTPSGKYIIGIGDGKIYSFDADGKKLESNSDKTYLKNIQVSAVSDKHIAFVLDNSLILGTLDGLTGK